MSVRLMSVSMTLGLALAAAAVDFPNADGLGDLASEGSWGASVPDDSNVVVIKASGTYTASADVTFSGLTAQMPYGGSAVFDLTAAPGRKVTLKGSTWNKYNVPNDLTSVELKGGVWDFMSGGTLYVGNSNNAKNNRHWLTLSSGAVVTNVANLFVANYDMSNRLAVVENSSLCAGTVTIIAPTAGTRGSGIEILSGGRLLAASTFKWDNGYNANAGDSYVHVSGNSSRLDAGDYTYIGFQCAGNELVVSNGAAASFTGSAVYLGNQSTSARNSILVADGATMSFGTGTTFYLGNSAGANENRFDILDGASVTFKRANDMFMGYKGSDNVVTVSNATMTATSGLVWGDDAGCSGNELAVCGTNPVVSASSISMKNGSRLSIVLPDEPYAAGCVPVSASTVSMDSTCTLSVGNLDGYIDRSKGRSNVIVARATTSLDIPAEVIAAANAGIASRHAYFYLSGDGKELWLCAPVNRGFMMIFK